MNPKNVASSAERSLYSDRDYISGMQSLDKSKLMEFQNLLELDLACGINFYNQLEHTMEIKARAGYIDKKIESRLARIGEQAVEASEHAVGVMKEINVILKQNKIDQAIDRHMPSILKGFDTNPKVKDEVRKMKRMGLTDISMKCIHDELAKYDFDILRIRGANGTISGLIKTADIKLVDFRNMVDIIHKQGIPTLIGGGNGTAGAVVGTLLVIGGVIIVVSWFV